MGLVRNFWIRTAVDNKIHPVATGPKEDDGGMYTTLSVRNEGCSKSVLTILCTASHDGTLRVIVRSGEGKEVYRSTTKR